MYYNASYFRNSATMPRATCRQAPPHTRMRFGHGAHWEADARWRRHAGPSALAHCRGRLRRRRPKFTHVDYASLGVNVHEHTV